MDKISKRKLESYKRAEMVCQELRYQISIASRNDMNKVCNYLLYWMDKTGNIKYNRPKKLKVNRKTPIIPDPPNPPPKRVIREGIRIIQE